MQMVSLLFFADSHREQRTAGAMGNDVGVEWNGEEYMNEGNLARARS